MLHTLLGRMENGKLWQPVCNSVRLMKSPVGEGENFACFLASTTFKMFGYHFLSKNMFKMILYSYMIFLPGRVEAVSRVSGLCPGILRHPFGAPDEDQLDFYRGKELSGHQAGHADFSVRNSAKKLWVWGKSTRIYYGHPE